MMGWNVFEKLKEKLTGKTAELAAKAAVAAATKPAEKEGAEGAMPDFKELEKKGMLGQFFRHWKNPAFLQQIKAVAARMQSEGVDVKDQKAVQAWLAAHQKELEAGTVSRAEAKQETYIKTGPDIGRNDPCHCGSGKKFKKCHGANA